MPPGRRRIGGRKGWDRGAGAGLRVRSGGGAARAGAEPGPAPAAPATPPWGRGDNLPAGGSPAPPRRRVRCARDGSAAAGPSACESRGLSAGCSRGLGTAGCWEGGGHAAGSWAVKRGWCVSASAGVPGALLVQRVSPSLMRKGLGVFSHLCENLCCFLVGATGRLPRAVRGRTGQRKVAGRSQGMAWFCRGRWVRGCPAMP